VLVSMRSSSLRVVRRREPLPLLLVVGGSSAAQSWLRCCFCLKAAATAFAWHDVVGTGDSPAIAAHGSRKDE
jgi:hypothetical protein